MKNMKNYVLSAVVATVGLFGAHAESSAEKPNILFILADDQCYDTIHALGNPEIQTPSLDRLVERGTSFSNTYNMGAWELRSVWQAVPCSIRGAVCGMPGACMAIHELIRTLNFH